MSLLPDHEILRLGSTLVAPFNPQSVQPASYDLTLHAEALSPPSTRFSKTVDLRVDSPKELMRKVDLSDGFDLLPGSCLLASTFECVKCPADIAARVEGKSSLGRLFLAVHVTAGWIDPGWCGQVTLEVVNHGPWSVRLWAGMKIAQINFTRMHQPCLVPYGSAKLGSHYQNQEGPTAAVGKRGYEEAHSIQEGTLKKMDR